MRETIQNATGKQFHAVSLSGGKDNEKKNKMERTSLKARKEPEENFKLFP